MRTILKRVLGLVAVYAIALQAVLGVWAGATHAAASADPLAVLCQTSTGGPAAPDHAPDSHRFDCVCATACAHMPMAALPEAAGLPSSPEPVAATHVAIRIEADSAASWRGAAQPRAPPFDV